MMRLVTHVGDKVISRFCDCVSEYVRSLKEKRLKLSVSNLAGPRHALTLK